ncbi:MAG: hypothetical protein HOV97_05800 [Nonomuraea sp.]|nr:hypothetical protein [Nonomuraea sp.]
MGGTTFDHYAPGADARKAFDEAHEQAGYEYGHGGYSGTIAEKGDFTIITRTPLLESEAYALANKLIEADDPRVRDKWGPAGAIPVVSATRKVRVQDFEYVHDHDHADYGKVQPALLEAVTPLVKLKKGETIQSVAMHSYQTPSTRTGGYGGSYYGGRARVRKVTYKQCQATVTINKPPATRIAPVTFEIPGGLDWQAKAKEIETRVQSMKLKAGESIVSHRVTRDTPGPAKVTAVAGGGPNEKRFIVKGARQHDTWETGFTSQAEARAWATEYMKSDRDFGDSGVLEVESVTRRADGEPLVRITREVTKRQVDVDVEVKLAGAGQQATPDGWLFFGWAST